jgi:hypothetical protein
MYNQIEGYQRAAHECLEAARSTTDLAKQAALIMMAQRWLERSKGSGLQDCEILAGWRAPPQILKH